MLSNREKFEGKTVGLVLCGGNIDTRLLANVLVRDLARQVAESYYARREALGFPALQEPGQ